MGLEIVLASLSAGGTLGSTLTAVYGGVGAAALRIAGSFVLGKVGQYLAGKPQQQELKRDLGFPTSRPSYRYPYGRDRVPATPLPYPVVGDYAYGCWLVSSRVAEGPFTVFLDNREVLLTGDPYDFTSGGGATGTEYPFEDHVTIWIGLGDQTSPPQDFLDEAGYVVDGDELLWKAGDIGSGCVVVFAKLRAGDNGKRSERWPSAVPSVELEGNFSKVWDPREPLQDPDDPETWTWSNNAALCALDVLTQNPFRPYELRNLAVSMWEDYASIADETVALKSGGSEPRYITSGVVVFDGSELADINAPLLACGGARLTQSGGQTGVVPAAPRSSVVTVTDSLEGLGYSALTEDANLVTEVRVNYSPIARGGEPAELSPWSIPGALDADGGQPSVKMLDLTMVPSATQAQRLRNTYGKAARLQRTLRLTAPASALTAVSGSVIDVSLPDPYGLYANRQYEVQSIGAAVHMLSESGSHMRLPMVLSEYSDDVHLWDPVVDEEDIVHVPYDSQIDGVKIPGVLSVTTGPDIDVNSGGSITPRFLFQFDPSESASVVSYEWEWRVNGGVWQTGGFIDKDVINASGKVFFHLNAAQLDAGHDVRVRSIANTGRSDYVELTGAIYSIGISGVMATAEPGRVRFTGTASDGLAIAGVRPYYAAVGATFANALPLTATLPVSPGAAFDVIAGDPDAVNALSGGTFDDPVAFATTGGWSIAGGEATHTTGGQSWMRQAVSDLAQGPFIRITFELSGRTTGTVGFRATSADGSFKQTTTGVNGTLSRAIEAPDDIVELAFFGGSTFDGTIDNASVVFSSPLTVPHGQTDVWLVPVTVSGVEATPVGPFTVQII